VQNKVLIKVGFKRNHANLIMIEGAPLLIFFGMMLLTSCLPQYQYFSFDQGDQNKNGIRDDVEEYISKNYKDENEVRALYLYSHKMWSLVESEKTGKEFIDLYIEKQRSLGCVQFVFAYKEIEFGEIYSRILNRHINSYSNWKKYRKYQSKLNYEISTGRMFFLREIVKKPEGFCAFSIKNKAQMIEKIKQLRGLYD